MSDRVPGNVQVQFWHANEQMDAFERVLIDIQNLHRKKAADYGSDEDPLANIRAAEEFGIPPWVGAVLRSNDKMHRIKVFVKRGNLENESVDDSLIDIATYMILALVLKGEK
jgi:hypothetical protein